MDMAMSKWGFIGPSLAFSTPVMLPSREIKSRTWRRSMPAIATSKVLHEIALPVVHLSRSGSTILCAQLRHGELVFRERRHLPNVGLAELRRMSRGIVCLALHGIKARNVKSRARLRSGPTPTASALTMRMLMTCFVPWMWRRPKEDAVMRQF
jgi:hypothetical protein